MARVLFAVLLLAWSSSSARAQCRIEGALHTQDGAPIEGVTIRVQGPDLRSAMTATTAADGRFAIDGVTPGIRVEIIAIQKNGRALAHAYTLVTLPIEKIDLRPEPLLAGAAGDADLFADAGPSGEVRGTIRAANGAVVPGAIVAIGDTLVTATADSAGRYAFDRLRPGLALELDVAADGFSSAKANVVVPANDKTDTDFSLVEAHRTSTAAGGEAPAAPVVTRSDPFRSVRSLPSVAGSNERLSELSVRGATPDQTLITYDGVTLYPIPHLFDTFTAVNPDAIQTARFAEGPLDAADGGRLSALRLAGAAPATGTPSGSVEVGMLGGSAEVSVPIANRVGLMFAARRSPPGQAYDYLLDRVDGGGTATTRDRLARFSGGVFTLPTASMFYDLNGKILISPSSRDRVSASVYDGYDAANRSRDIPLPQSTDVGVPTPVTLPADLVAQNADLALWKGRAFGATWNHQWSSSASTAVSVGRSEFSKDTAWASLLTSATTSQNYSSAAGRGGTNGLTEANTIDDTTLRLSQVVGVGFEHLVTVGGELASVDTSYAASTEASARLVGFFGQSGTGRVTTVFAQDAWRPLGRLTITPGVRITHFDLTASTFFDPRFSATYLVMPQLRVSAGWAVDDQPVSRVPREDLTHGDGEFWSVADGGRVLVPHSRQAFGTAALEIADFLWTATAYRRVVDDQTMFAPRLFPGTIADVAGTFLHHGSTTATGFEMLIERKTRWNTARASYAWRRVVDTFPTLEADTFPDSHVQANEFKIADSARPGRGWSLGAAWVIASGRPTTPADGVHPVWFPSGSTVDAITFGPKNSDQLPAYDRLDLSAERAFRFRALTTTLGVDLLNAYDRQNVAYREYEIVAGSMAATDVPLMRRVVDAHIKLAF